jgi:hypothetical protein
MKILWQHIRNFEDAFPNRKWVLYKQDNGGYQAASCPIRYIYKMGEPNPQLIRSIGKTPDEAFEMMYLQTLRFEGGKKQ